MSKKTNVAVVGLGHRGSNILDLFKQDERVDRIVGVDLNEERKKNAREQCPWAEFDYTFEQVLDDQDINCVVIATPAEAHYPLAMKAVGKSKNLLIEQPVAQNCSAAKSLIARAKETGSILMIGNAPLYNEAIVKVKEIIDSGDIGRLLYIRSVHTNLRPTCEDVNVLWDLAIHEITIFDYLFGEDPVQVSCNSFSPRGLKREDVRIGSLEYSGNRSANFFVSWLDPFKTHEITIVGYQKTLTLNPLNQERPLLMHNSGVQPVEVTSGQPLHKECLHFIDCVLEGKDTTTEQESSNRVIKILEALQESSVKHGAPVNIFSK